jgi:hypothetical protein
MVRYINALSNEPAPSGRRQIILGLRVDAHAGVMLQPTYADGDNVFDGLVRTSMEDIPRLSSAWAHTRMVKEAIQWLTEIGGHSWVIYITPEPMDLEDNIKEAASSNEGHFWADNDVESLEKALCWALTLAAACC